MPPRGMRTYVDVIVRVSAGGVENPRAIILPNGRMFEIDHVGGRTRFEGGMALSVHIGEHVTSLYKDTTGWNGARWYVVMRGAGAPAFEQA